MKKNLKKLENAIDKIKNISNNINMGYIKDLEWMRLNGLFTMDQVKMIIDKKAFVSNQIPNIWIFKNWKLGE